MGSRLALVLALFLAAAAPAHAASVKLFHDSFDTRYRTPFGAVPAGTKVTLSKFPIETHENHAKEAKPAKKPREEPHRDHETPQLARRRCPADCR